MPPRLKLSSAPGPRAGARAGGPRRAAIRHGLPRIRGAPENAKRAGEAAMARRRGIQLELEEGNQMLNCLNFRPVSGIVLE